MRPVINFFKRILGGNSVKGKVVYSHNGPALKVKGPLTQTSYLKAKAALLAETRTARLARLDAESKTNPKKSS
jgi:hypothetical protein